MTQAMGTSSWWQMTSNTWTKLSSSASSWPSGFSPFCNFSGFYQLKKANEPLHHCSIRCTLHSEFTSFICCLNIIEFASNKNIVLLDNGQSGSYRPPPVSLFTGLPSPKITSTTTATWVPRRGSSQIWPCIWALMVLLYNSRRFRCWGNRNIT